MSPILLLWLLFCCLQTSEGQRKTDGGPFQNGGQKILGGGLLSVQRRNRGPEVSGGGQSASWQSGEQEFSGGGQSATWQSGGQSTGKYVDWQNGGQDVPIGGTPQQLPSPGQDVPIGGTPQQLPSPGQGVPSGGLPQQWLSPGQGVPSGGLPQQWLSPGQGHPFGGFPLLWPSLGHVKQLGDSGQLFDFLGGLKSLFSTHAQGFVDLVKENSFGGLLKQASYIFIENFFGKLIQTFTDLFEVMVTFIFEITTWTDGIFTDFFTVIIDICKVFFLAFAEGLLASDNKRAAKLANLIKDLVPHLDKRAITIIIQEQFCPKWSGKLQGLSKIGGKFVVAEQLKLFKELFLGLLLYPGGITILKDSFWGGLSTVFNKFLFLFPKGLSPWNTERATKLINCIKGFLEHFYQNTIISTAQEKLCPKESGKQPGLNRSETRANSWGRSWR